MRVLIYEPLPDMNRAPIIAQLARTLMENGHDVLVALEEKLIYTLLGKLTPQGVINCSRTWRRHIATNPKIKTYRLDTPPGLYWFVTPSNLEQRLSRISEIRKEQFSYLLATFNPEKIFVWNGQHEHLQDFMSLARQTHKDKFIYMECGWFPQKGTIYFDTEGVNAASSITKQKRSTLTASEKHQLETWQRSHLQNNRTPIVSKRIFVPLQVETDTNITLHSPFKTMQEFVDYLCDWVPKEYRLVIRPHPLSDPQSRPTIRRAGCTIESTTSIEELIDSAEFIIGINSTVLLEALARNKPVIGFGKGFLNTTAPDASFHDAAINTFNTATPLLYTLIFEKQDLTNSCKKANELLMQL